MGKKILIIVDTDTEFAERFKERIEINKLNEKYDIFNIVPNTRNKNDIISSTLANITQYNENDICAIFIDIVVIEVGTKLDTTGINIANEIKKYYQKIPVYNITSKVLDDQQLDILSEATMENNDGVFTKYFLEGDKFNQARLEKILNPPSISEKQKHKNKKGGRQYHFAIITALYDDEFENIKRIFNFTDTEEDDVKIYHKGTTQFICKDGKNRDFNFVAIHQHKTGMVDAAIYATEIVTKYNPKILIMTGVCGGKDEESLKLGDLVFANKLFIYQKGKEGEHTFLPEGEFIDIDEKIVQKIKENKKNLIRKVMDEDLSRSSKYQEKPLQLFIEPMACSTSVINKDGFFDERIAILDRKTISVDMESYAVARACNISNNKLTKPVIIKSFMDKTKGKNDDAKSYAAFTSSLFLKYLITDVLYEMVE